MLNNRDIAALFWLIVIIGWAASKPAVRGSMMSAARSFADRKVLLVIALYAVWMAAVITVASALSLWNTAMVRDTVVAVFAGLGIVVGAASASSNPSFFKQRVRRAIALTVFLEVYLNLASFDLIWELILQPVLFVLIGLSVLAPRVEGGIPVKRVADWALAAIGLVVLVPPTLLLMTRWGQLDTAQTLREFLLPVWMVIGALPFAFAFAVFASYETAYVRLKWMSPEKRVPRHVVAALVQVYGLDYTLLAGEVAPMSWGLVRTKSRAEAVALIRKAKEKPGHTSPEGSVTGL